MKMSFCVKRLISLLASLVITAGIFSAPGLSAPIYAEETSERNSKTVKVTVTATPAGGGEDVPVSGALVSVYRGDGRKGETVNYVDSFETGEDGIAECVIPIPAEYRDDDKKANEYLSTLTFSAKKKVANSKGMDYMDSEVRNYRDRLFQVYRDGADNRIQVELHSETLDENGNWLGDKLPLGDEKDVDLAFVIDTTGSMSPYIRQVKNNIVAFARSLEDQGRNLRMSVIEFRDIKEDGEGSTKLHYNASGSPWFLKVDDLQAELDRLSVNGGGDDDETPIDALDMLLHQSDMKWRSSANKFSFVLTDAGCKTDNSHGYGSLKDVANQLKDYGIVTSVITTSGAKVPYEELYKTGGGQYTDIKSGNFSDQMLALAEGIIGHTNGDLTLHLHEPRILVDLSLCYYAYDEDENGEDYYRAVKNLMNNISINLAQATDGHVVVNRGYIFRTNIRENFYITPGEDGNYDYANAPTSAMADIRIISAKDEKSTISIRSNANVNGYYSNNPVDPATENKKWLFAFDFDNVEAGKKEFPRAQLSSYNNSWNHTFDESYSAEEDKYSKAIVHELGHYLLSLFDEYNYFSWNEKKNKYEWLDCKRPKDAPFRGMMEEVRQDLEMSDADDYRYITEASAEVPDQNRTSQWMYYGKSCEDALADLLTTGKITFGTDSRASTDTKTEEQFFTYTSPYKVEYTKRDSRRRADYDYAALVIRDKDGNVVKDNIVDLTDPANWKDHSTKTTASAGMQPYKEMAPAAEPVADITAWPSGENVRIGIRPKKGSEVYLYTRTSAGDVGSTVTPIPVNDGQAEVKLARGKECELTVVARDGAGYVGNTYTLERSFNSPEGYGFMSGDMTVMGSVIPEKEDEYTFLNMDQACEQGEYVSVNHAVQITSANKAPAKGQLVSAASAESDINFASVTWFKSDGKTWKELPTELAFEQDLTMTAVSDYEGDGTYVLMAKPAAKTSLKAPADLAFTEDTSRDGCGVLSFTDGNPASRYYDIYISEKPFTAGNPKDAVRERRYAEGTSCRIILPECDRDYYIALAAVAEDGAVSDLSKVLEVRSGAADRDGDGIPDWYCDKYSLWPYAGAEKNIADSDDDRDGLTNLAEYREGSSPMNPFDPHTIVSAESVQIDSGDLTMDPGDKVTVNASVKPADATDQTVEWQVEDEAVLKITPDGLQCRLEACAAGETKVHVITRDGGFTATINVVVGGKETTRPDEGDEEGEDVPDDPEDPEDTDVTLEGIPNITDEILLMNVEDAAEYLGLTQKQGVYEDGWDHYIFYHYRKGTKLFDGSSYIENFEGFQDERALWDIVVSDRTIAFQGLAVGMTEAEAESVLPDHSWTYDSEYSDPDNDEELLCFSKDLLEGQKIYADITVKNNKVTCIECYWGAD